MICDAGALCCISIYGGILREYVMGVYHECVLCMSVYYETWGINERISKAFMAISYLGRAHIFMPASLLISASSSTVANVPWDRRHSLHHHHSSHRMHCSNHTVHRPVIYTSLHCNYSLPDNLTWKSSVGFPNSCERKMALTLDSTLSSSVLSASYLQKPISIGGCNIQL